jgi:diguanylate cyclase (GGDEF)-like protein
MRRGILFACAGGVFSAGVPLGLLAMRLARRGHGRLLSIGDAADEIRQNRPDYIYVGTSVAVAFALYGNLLGRHADQLAELSETDPLTGLSNARRLFSALDLELARVRRYRRPLALLLVDLDGLKGINDRYGHQAGDQAIRGLGDVIRSQLRSTDVGARWGGDEFAVLAPNTGEPAALALAERIRASIPTVSARWPLTGSLGVATVEPGADGDVDDAATLMRAADAALYEAKQRGRNRVVKALTHPAGTESA